MRKNRTKHEAKKPRLAKRALALCFALIFVCSCLLPAFAHSGENQLTDLAQETVVEQQQDEQKPEELSLLNESGENPTEGDEEQDEQKQEEANASKETSKEPSSSSSGEASGESQSTVPGESASSEGSTSTAPGESASSSSASSSASSEESAASSSASSEEPAASSTSSSEAASSSASASSTVTSGDVINQGEAVYTYRFWTKEIDAFDLERVNLAVNNGENLIDAAKSVTGIAPCEVLKVANHAHLADYAVTEPTKDGYEFAGWYTLKDGTAYEFSFDQNVSFEESKTIDVFAKWNKLEAVKSDALSNGGMTVEAKVGPMANVKSVALAEPSQNDAEKLRNSIDKQLYDQSYMVTIFDITPKDKDGMDVEPQNGESVNVEISGLDFSAGDNVWVYHLTNSGRVETLSATVTSDGGVAFTTKSFSPFAVVKLTEDVSSFGTEDDRLATADLQLNYEMKVGDTNTLYGGSRYYYYHKWSSSNPDVVAVTGSDYSARVEAKSVGTAEITHYHGYSSSYYWTESTNVTVVSPTGSWVYLYAAFEGNNIKGYTPSGSPWANKNWVTIGKLWVENIADISGNSSTDGTHVTNGTNYTNVIKALNEYKNSADTTKFERFEANKGINIDYIVWNRIETITENGIEKNIFGLSQGGGANHYVPNPSTPTWHLDGYAQRVGAYKINYLEKGTHNVLKPSVESVGTAGTEINAENFKEDPITVGGKTYKYIDCDKTYVTIEEGNTVEINLYYEHEVDLGSLPKSDEPFIMVEKRFSGLTENTLPQSFKIVAAGHECTVNNATTKYQDGNDYVVRWKVEVENAGSYNVSESGYQKGGFTVTTEINDNPVPDPTTGTQVTVAVPELKSWTPNVIPEKSKRNFKVNMDGNTNNIFVARLKHAVIVFTQKPLSNAQRDAVKDKLATQSMGPGGFWYDSSKKIYFYSVEEQLAHGTLIIDGTTVRYDASNHEIVFSEQSFWTHVATVSYSTTNAENPEVSITNTYTPATTSLTVTKHVAEGNAKVPDNAEFKFKLTVGSEKEFYEGVTITPSTPSTNVEHTANMNEWTFTLQAGDSVNISGIRLDDTNVKVEEVINDNHYTTKHKVNDEAEVDGKEATFSTLKQNGNTVVFTNTYNVPNLNSMTIQKKVTGEFGDRDKSFTFSVKLSNDKRLEVIHSFSNAATRGDLSSFTLKHGEYVTLGNIPVGTTITVTETDADEYKTKATDHGESKDRIFVYEVVEGKDGNAVLKAKNSILGIKVDETVKDNAIVVTNNFDGNPDTGVLLDTLPYLILLAVAVAGGVLVVVRKRKHRDE